MEEVITRYLIKVSKYLSKDSQLSKIGEELVETDSATMVHFPPSELLSDESMCCFSLDFVEERKYKKSLCNPGMIERID